MPKKLPVQEKLIDTYSLRFTLQDAELIRSAGTADQWRARIVDMAKMILQEGEVLHASEGSEDVQCIEAQR